MSWYGGWVDMGDELVGGMSWLPFKHIIHYIPTFFQLALIKQPSPRRVSYCIPHGPPPQLIVFKIATYLSTSSSSYFTLPSHTTGKLFWWHFDHHIITPWITMSTRVYSRFFLVGGSWARGVHARDTPAARFAWHHIDGKWKNLVQICGMGSDPLQ